MTSPPSFLSPLLSPSSPIPIYPLPVSIHSKPTFPTLTAPIADGAFHPALEAALHLANGDLYSAHFLVRKGQGGRRELDWGHGLLHRLEGDWGNAKCWYTDVYALASSSSSPSSSSPPHLFQTFWTSPPSGDTSTPPLSSALSHPSQYLDLLHLYSLLPSSFTTTSAPPLEGEAQRVSLAGKVYRTSRYAPKLEEVPHYSSAQVASFLSQPSTLPLSRAEVELFARHEVQTLLLGGGERFGWQGQSMQESVRAFEVQKGMHDEPGEERQGGGGGGGGPGRVDHNAQGMVLGRGGNRKF